MSSLSCWRGQPWRPYGVHGAALGEAGCPGWPHPGGLDSAAATAGEDQGAASQCQQDQPRGEGEGDRDNPVCAVYDRLVFVFVLYSSCLS